MRIYNRSLKKTISSILFFLTIEEAKQLRDMLKGLKNNPSEVVTFTGKDCNGNLTKSLSIRIYDKQNLNNFDEEIIKIIETGR